MAADFGTGIVAVHVDLITAHVEDISVEELQKLLVDVRQDLVHFLVDNVQLKKEVHLAKGCFWQRHWIYVLW